jgi:hypothetical protein
MFDVPVEEGGAGRTSALKFLSDFALRPSDFSVNIHQLRLTTGPAPVSCSDECGTRNYLALAVTRLRN